MNSLYRSFNLLPRIAVTGRNDNEDLSISWPGEPVSSLNLHPTTGGGLRRREYDEMYRPIHPVKELSFQTGTSRKARKISKYRLSSEFVPWAQEPLNNGLDNRRNFAVGFPAVREKSIIVLCGVNPGEESGARRERTVATLFEALDRATTRKPETPLFRLMPLTNNSDECGLHHRVIFPTMIRDLVSNVNPPLSWSSWKDTGLRCTDAAAIFSKLSG